jgi:hypothetical protein
MTSQEAIFICEHMDDEITTHDDLQHACEAWQTLINSGLVWHLQGWYGRTAENLIEDGYCYNPSDETIH